MVTFKSNGKSKHLPKGQEFTVTKEMYEIFVKAGYVDGKESKKVETESK